MKRSLELIVGGAPLRDVLTHLVRAVDAQGRGQAVASILLLDEQRRLRNGASPGLPADYLLAIDGLEPDAELGTCAAAAATGKTIVTPDIDADPRWQRLKHLPLGLGFRAAWSRPIIARNGCVLGTFGTYFRERRGPSRSEVELVEILSGTAALAIERECAEQRLQDTASQLALITDLAPVLIAHCDTEARYKFVNRAYAERFGLTPADCIGKRIPEIVGEAAYEAFRGQVEAVLRGKAVEFEVEIPYATIGSHFMRCSYAPELSPRGNVVGLVAAITDITDRKRAEQQLRASQAELRLTSEAARIGIWRWNVTTGELSWSAMHKELWGYEPSHEPLTYADWASRLDPDDLRLAEDAIRSCLDGKSEYDAEYRIVPPGCAETRWIRSTGWIERDTAGATVAMQGVSLDVTERRQAEDALLHSERRFRTLASHAPVGIFQTDADGNCAFVNEKWCELAGMSADAALGRGWVDALHPDDRDRVFHEWYEAARSGQEFASEYRFQTPTGQVSWLKGSALALRDAGGKISGHLGSIVDITERKRAEEHRELLINELNHRVKNTLATVQAIAVQTLRGVDPDLRDRFEGRLIALSNSHSLLTQQNWQSADIREIVRQILEPQADPVRLRIEGPRLHLAPQAAVAIAMTIHELATNALKYGALSNETGRITVSWSIAGSLLKLVWRECGGPPVTAPTRKGFGTRLIERNLPHDLNGEATLSFPPEGVVCTITTRLTGRRAPSTDLEQPS